MRLNNAISSIPELSPRAFWDIDMRTLDFDRYAAFIVTRVFERGTRDDIQAISQFYGEDKVIDILTHNINLLPAALETAKQKFNLPDNAFSCSIKTRRARNYSRF